MSHPGSTLAPVSIPSFVSDLGLAPRQSHKLLTLWPLVAEGRESQAPPYGSLHDALAAGTLDVTEIPGGSVPNVGVTNRGKKAVLVIFGEQIVGAMQNRTANASFLVGAGEQVVIDVSCVEAGRWDGRRSRDPFASSGDVVSSLMRRKMADKVRRARALGLRFDADQGEVWSSVSERLRSSRVASHSSSYEDYRSSRTADLGEARKAFLPVPGQLGFVAMIGDEVAGLEVIGRPEVFARAHRGLLEAYLIDAIDHAAVQQASPRPPSAPRFDDPSDFLASVAAAPGRRGPSLGLGDDIRLNGCGISGCALLAGDVVHLTAFPAEGA